MTVEDIKKLVVDRVEALQGAKGPELITDVICMVKDTVGIGPEFDEIDLPNLLDELVSEGKLVEIEYTIPQIEYRVKSLYLPAGTKVRLHNARPYNEI